MTVLANYLKQNIPEYFQTKRSDGSDNDLVQYLNGVGSFLEEIREAINQFEIARDPYRATKFELDGAVSDFGISLPTNLPIEKKREFLRDINEIIKKGGTKDWLNLIMRFVGGQYDIQDAWIYDPVSFANGYYRDISTGLLERIEIDNLIYTKFLYGDYVVGGDGVHFEGYKYQDFKKLNPFHDVPILGETYEINYQSHHCVAKTPYVLVRLKSGLEGFNVDVEDYVDENGTTYSFTTSEKYQIANDLISYFLTSVQRPSTVKIIVSVNEASIGQEDVMTIVDEIAFLETVKTYIDTQLDTMTMSDTATAKQSVPIRMRVGNTINVGSVETPISNYAVLKDAFIIGGAEKRYNELENWSSYSINIPYSLDKPYDIRTRALTDISFTNLSASSLRVLGGNIDATGSISRTQIATVEIGNAYNFNNQGQYFLLRVEPVVPLVDNLPIQIVAQQLNRGL